MAKIFLKLLSFYKGAVSPYLGFRCRYIPSCSDYMSDAVKEKGLIKGVISGAYRICRCAPGMGSGFDPVPSDLSKIK